MRGMIGLSGALLLAMTGGVLAEEVTEKVEVKATKEAAWALIGDFCGIKNWHPVIVGCDIKMDGSAKVRTLTAKDGAQFVEKEVARDDKGESYTYTILTSPLPLKDYKSTLSVTGSGATATITWTGTFTPNTAGNGVEKVVASIYQAGLDGLKNKLGGM